MTTSVRVRLLIRSPPFNEGPAESGRGDDDGGSLTASPPVLHHNRVNSRPPPVGALGLAGQQGHVAVHGHPPAVSTGQIEGGPAMAGERLSVRTGGAGGPGGGDPRRIVRSDDGRRLLEAEVADARPDLAPLLALDVGEP